MKNHIISFGRKLQVIQRVIRGYLPLSDFDRQLIVVGAQKAGTSALYSYLSSHPQLACSEIKETHFFDREIDYAKGFGFYRSFFPVICPGCMSFEATPSYLYRKNCAKRIYEYAPSAKIVIIMREPVSRTFSAYNMYQQIMNDKRFAKLMKIANQDSRDFFLPLMDRKGPLDINSFLERELEIISVGGDEEEPSLIRRGIYLPQIKKYIEFFGRENVLLLFSDDLKNNPGHTVDRVLDFADLDPMHSREYPLKHVRTYTVDQVERAKISNVAGELFRRDRADLVRTYGLNVPW